MKTKTRMQNMARAAKVAGEDSVDVIRRGRMRSELPQLSADQQRVLRDLQRDGVAKVENYWPRERALAVRDQLETHLEGGEDRDYNNGAYLRFQDDLAYDAGVRRIYHVDKLERDLGELRDDRWVLDVAGAYYGLPFYSGMLMYQYNTQSNANTRGTTSTASTRSSSPSSTSMTSIYRQRPFCLPQRLPQEPRPPRPATDDGSGAGQANRVQPRRGRSIRQQGGPPDGRGRNAAPGGRPRLPSRYAAAGSLAGGAGELHRAIPGGPRPRQVRRGPRAPR